EPLVQRPTSLKWAKQQKPLVEVEKIHWNVLLSERRKIFGVPLLAKGACPKGRFLLFEAEGRVQKSSDRAVEGSKILRVKREETFQ
ncbi:MAG: hypothetical protein HY538_03945, partial [Deltaproteobacteria bacterium]|nr:hypothetical protein [Deltaproteobacteria bacterium]